MSTLERSPKRQRGSGSFSPASPPYHLTKAGEPQTKKSDPHPQTPQSPSRMSSTYHVSPQQTFPTPPSTAGSSSQMPNSSMRASVEPSQQATNTSQNTPMSLIREGDGDTQMHDSVMTNAKEDAVMADADTDHRRSDHERQGHEGESGSSSLASKAGPSQLSCQTSHPRSTPYPSSDLISSYSLNSIAASVARRDPTTGEKINKSRKSYEGKVKNLGSPGRNKPTIVPGELLGFLEWPEDMWQEQRVEGKELERSVHDHAASQSKSEKAVAMAPGRLPGEEHEKWKRESGLEDGSGGRTPVVGPSGNAKGAVNQLKSAAAGTGVRASAPSSPRGAVRPDRAGKKRRYDDSSYEGYADDDGYSTGGADEKRSSASKKRRKDTSFDASPNNFAGSGMVGVRSS